MKAKFRQVDVTRALRAAQSVGMKVGKVEITAEGGIVITPEVVHMAPSKESAVPSEGLSDFQIWKAKQREKAK